MSLKLVSSALALHYKKQPKAQKPEKSISSGAATSRTVFKRHAFKTVIGKKSKKRLEKRQKIIELEDMRKANSCYVGVGEGSAGSGVGISREESSVVAERESKANLESNLKLILMLDQALAS